MRLKLRPMCESSSFGMVTVNEGTFTVNLVPGRLIVVATATDLADLLKSVLGFHGLHSFVTPLHAYEQLLLASRRASGKSREALHM